MHAPDLNSFAQAYDWDLIFRRVLICLMVVCVLPADLFMRVQTEKGLGASAYLLVIPALGYALPFILNKKMFLKNLLLALGALNAAVFLFAFRDFFYTGLQPLIILAGRVGFLYSTLYLTCAIFGITFHVWLLKRIWDGA